MRVDAWSRTLVAPGSHNRTQRVAFVTGHNGMLIALEIGFCAACRSASALLSVAAGVASAPVQFNVCTLISMIITIHPSNAIVPMTRTAASQRNLTSGTVSWLAGSERGMGADTGEANGLAGWPVVARSPALSVVGVASNAAACTVVIAGTDILLSRGARWRLRAISFIGMALQPDN